MKPTTKQKEKLGMTYRNVSELLDDHTKLQQDVINANAEHDKAQVRLSAKEWKHDPLKMLTDVWLSEGRTVVVMPYHEENRTDKRGMKQDIVGPVELEEIINNLGDTPWTFNWMLDLYSHVILIGFATKAEAVQFTKTQKPSYVREISDYSPVRVNTKPKRIDA